MKKYIVLLACCVMVFQLLSLAARAQAPVLAIGDAAPAVQVRQWLKGSPVSSFEKGKVYVVEFWATWCQPCIAGMPHLSELAAQHKGKVTVAGISIMERQGTGLPVLQAFVDKMGEKMAYNVAAEDSNFMATRWLRASGERGIPCAYVIDQQGRIAWIGLPKQLDTVLPKVLNGKWDIKAALAYRTEDKRLTALDQEVIPRLNPFMGNPGRPQEALVEIEKILAATPGLKYYPLTGHFTFYSLLKTDPEKALAFGKKWLAVSSIPQWKTVTDAVRVEKEYPKGIYELAAASFQAQLDNYPWSMNFPTTYSNIAALQHKTGNKAKAIEAAQQAIAAAKKVTSFAPAEMEKLEANLATYQSM